MVKYYADFVMVFHKSSMEDSKIWFSKSSIEDCEIKFVSDHFLCDRDTDGRL